MFDKLNPKISIGLPVYNGGAYLRQAIESLLQQTFKNFELIVSDNCSTDETEAICREFAARDERIVYHRNTRNLGAAANFNRVVELARGRYFAWANHDDVWADSYLEECLRMLEDRADALLAYARSAKIGPDGNVIAPLMAGLGLDGPTPRERLRRFHDIGREIDRRNDWHKDEIEGLWIPVYGLMRTEALLASGMIGSYIASDTVLLEELLMVGAFIELDDTLFFKRDHPERSMRACVSYDKRIDWFTGKSGTRRLIFPRWRLFTERLRATLRVPQPIGRRLGCIAEMLAYYVRRSHEGRALVKEILINLRRLVPVPRSNSSSPQKW